jgi:hypothetical protein
MHCAWLARFVIHESPLPFAHHHHHYHTTADSFVHHHATYLRDVSSKYVEEAKNGNTNFRQGILTAWVVAWCGCSGLGKGREHPSVYIKLITGSRAAMH